MQELLGRLVALDPEASMGLRVIACFDELVVGNVNTRALLSAAAALAGCNAGFEQDQPHKVKRITPAGEVCTDNDRPSDVEALTADGLTVWLERVGPAHANDAIVLERLSLAMQVRHGRRRQEKDTRRDLGVVVDSAIAVEERQEAAARLGLRPSTRYRVVATPLFATWRRHPVVPEDVVLTPYGPVHTLVVRAEDAEPEATPRGVGGAAQVADLPRSFRAAQVALRLCTPPESSCIRADDYGGLVELLADSPTDADRPDVDLVAAVAANSWGPATLDALIRAATVREAARLAGVHHKTMQGRIDSIVSTLGFDPMVGLGRTRLGLAFLLWRLRHSTVLDLPPPRRGD